MSVVARREGPSFDADLAVKGFIRDPEWMFKAGIGGMINAGGLVTGLANPLMFPALLALSALTTGYAMRAVRYRALEVVDKLPDWNEWLELFVSGLTWVALQFGYWSLFAGFATIVVMVGMKFETLKTINFWITGGVLLIIAGALKTSFFASYLMVNFALEEDLKAGFAVREVIKRAWRDPSGLVGAWLLSMGLFGAAVIVPSLTIVGVFFVPSTVFAAQVMAADVLTQAWTKLTPANVKPLKKKSDKDGKSDNLPRPSGTKRNP
ncbi:MAG: DUF4013 domain-containing protein [Candidatus Obscuribacterales bacterium]